MKFLLSLLLIYILFRLVTGFVVQLWKSKLRKESQKKATNDDTGAQTRKKKKIFRRDEGDYVDFEEIGKPEN